MRQINSTLSLSSIHYAIYYYIIRTSYNTISMQYGIAIFTLLFKADASYNTDTVLIAPHSSTSEHVMLNQDSRQLHGLAS